MIEQTYLQRAHRVIERGTRLHYVYFIVADSNPRVVKIGTSHDPDKRLASLRHGGNNEPDFVAPHLGSLRLLGLLNGDGELEKQIHRAFSAYRVSGEWFLYDHVADAVDELLTKCVCRGCEMERAR